MKIRFLAFALALAATPLLGQQTPKSLAEAELPSLVAIYKDLHANPELSTREEKTAAFVAKELKAAGCVQIYQDPADLLARYEESPIVKDVKEAAGK